MARVIPFRGRTPEVAPDAFVAPDAVLIGDVEIGSEASVWFGAVLRGDHPENGIRVGARTSIQDNCVVHVGDWGPTIVGSDCTVGHGAKFESCVIEDRSIVGMNAVILQKAHVGRESLVAAGAVVLEDTRIPERSVVAGVPGKVRKSLDGSSADWIREGGRHYVELSREYLEAGIGRSEETCELCGGPTVERHCKIVCLNCGYRRDCSDP